MCQTCIFVFGKSVRARPKLSLPKWPTFITQQTVRQTNKKLNALVVRYTQRLFNHFVSQRDITIIISRPSFFHSFINLLQLRERTRELNGAEHWIGCLIILTTRFTRNFLVHFSSTNYLREIVKLNKNIFCDKNSCIKYKVETCKKKTAVFNKTAIIFMFYLISDFLFLLIKFTKIYCHTDTQLFILIQLFKL